MTNNTCIETLDFSDNHLSDEHGLAILGLIKQTSEQRDDQLFWASLRQDKPEKFLENKKTMINAENITQFTTNREINSTIEVRKLLENLDNPDINSHEVVLAQQAHVVNYKKQQILYAAGLRELILMRNRFGDGFAKNLQRALSIDKYLKIINVSGNQISEYGLKFIVKLALMDNTSLIGFDARLNPGCNEKLERQISLCMLKNIERSISKGLEINEKFLKPHLYSFGVP